MRKLILQFAVITLMMLPIPALAAELKANDGGDINLSESESHKNLYLAGRTITVDSTTEDDLVVAGADVTVNGKVKNSIFAASSTLNLNGEVENNARVAGSQVNINNLIKEDLLVAGQDITLTNKAQIDGDLMGVGENIEIGGTIKGDVKLSGKNVVISGNIKGNVLAKNVQSLKLQNGAVIEGNLNYSSKNEAIITGGSKVIGLIEYQKINRGWRGYQFWPSVVSFISSFVLLLIIVFLAPKFSKKLVVASYHSSLTSGLAGVAVLVGVPVAGFLLLISTVGAKIGIVAFLLYLFVAIIAGALAPLIMGAGIVKFVTRSKEFDASWPIALIGSLVFALVSRIPYFGFVVELVFYTITFGTLIIWIIKKVKTNAS